jgi:hypothetical protein
MSRRQKGAVSDKPGSRDRGVTVALSPQSLLIGAIDIFIQ